MSTLFNEADWPEWFLREHWQKQPLVVRGVPSGALPGISVDELFTLASRSEVSARWIELSGPPDSWSLRDGRSELTSERWTLLVQEIDRHLPVFAQLLESFRFIPNWRIDDVMVSYATDGGGVGPHIDRVK